MRLFRRRTDEASPVEPVPHPSAPEPPAGPTTPQSQPVPPEPVAPPEEPTASIEVSRTLVKSEPELAELVESEPRLQGKGIAVSMSEKGFGTRVAIAAGADAGLSESDLESLLDQLAEPQKRPFSNS